MEVVGVQSEASLMLKVCTPVLRIVGTPCTALAVEVVGVHSEVSVHNEARVKLVHTVKLVYRVKLA